MSKHTTWVRVVILFFSPLSLAVASLSAGLAHFAVILRNRARSDYINTADDILDNNFQSLQDTIFGLMLVNAVFTIMFAVYAAVIAVHPRLLREHDATLLYVFSQITLALAMITIGGDVANRVNGFQTSFKKFGVSNGIPYYDIMYYGAVAIAAYGGVLVLLDITFFIC